MDRATKKFDVSTARRTLLVRRRYDTMRMEMQESEKREEKKISVVTISTRRQRLGRYGVAMDGQNIRETKSFTLLVEPEYQRDYLGEATGAGWWCKRRHARVGESVLTFGRKILLLL